MRSASRRASSSRRTRDGRGARAPAAGAGRSAEHDPHRGRRVVPREQPRRDRAADQDGRARRRRADLWQRADGAGARGPRRPPPFRCRAGSTRRRSSRRLDRVVPQGAPASTREPHTVRLTPPYETRYQNGRRQKVESQPERSIPRRRCPEADTPFRQSTGIGDRVLDDEVVHPDEHGRPLHGIHLLVGGAVEPVVLVVPPARHVAPLPLVGLAAISHDTKRFMKYWASGWVGPSVTSAGRRRSADSCRDWRDPSRRTPRPRPT